MRVVKHHYRHEIAQGEAEQAILSAEFATKAALQAEKDVKLALGSSPTFNYELKAVQATLSTEAATKAGIQAKKDLEQAFSSSFSASNHEDYFREQAAAHERINAFNEGPMHEHTAAVKRILAMKQGDYYGVLGLDERNVTRAKVEMAFETLYPLTDPKMNKTAGAGKAHDIVRSAYYKLREKHRFRELNW